MFEVSTLMFLRAPAPWGGTWAAQRALSAASVGESTMNAWESSPTKIFIHPTIIHFPPAVVVKEYQLSSFNRHLPPSPPQTQLQLSHSSLPLFTLFAHPPSSSFSPIIPFSSLPSPPPNLNSPISNQKSTLSSNFKEEKRRKKEK